MFGGAARLVLPGVTGVGDRDRALHFGPGGTRAAMSPAASGPSSGPSCLRPACLPNSPTRWTTPRSSRAAPRDGQALALTGKDVGTPIIHFQPPDGVGFFGPVVSRLPSEAEAGPLWDNVLGLASFPGFAELNVACVSGRSYAVSAWNPARSASRRTGTPAAGAPRDSGA